MKMFFWPQKTIVQRKIFFLPLVLDQYYLVKPVRQDMCLDSKSGVKKTWSDETRSRRYLICLKSGAKKIWSGETRSPRNRIGPKSKDPIISL